MEKDTKKEILWASITKILVFMYVTIGGGYEIINGLTNDTVKTSFIFAFLSGCIFIGRIGYGIYSGAKRTIIADIYGLVVIWIVAFMSVYFNGWW